MRRTFPNPYTAKGKDMRSVVAMLLLPLVLVPLSQAQAAQQSYVILKEGEPVGTHDYAFAAEQGKLEVRVATHTKVKLLFLSFEYDHESTEIWRDGELESWTAASVKNGDSHKMQMTRNGNGYDLVIDGKGSAVDAAALPLTLWNEKITARRILYSAADGQPYRVKVRTLPAEVITVRGQPVKARRYSMTGDIDRELWYAEDGTFLRTTFTEKGFDIEWVLK